jgi:hypothetical protein
VEWQAARPAALEGHRRRGHHVVGQPDLLSAADFNAAVVAGMDPAATELGFVSRKLHAPAWSRKEPGGGMLFFHFQRHPQAVDPYAGGRFFVEFEHGRTTKPLATLAGRANLDQLLAIRDLEVVLDYQRKVISSLPHPPAEWVGSGPESARQIYLDNFNPNKKFVPGDLWHRYRTVQDVEGWLDIITRYLPDVLERVARMDPRTIYLGVEIDLDDNPLRPRNGTP